MHIMNVNALGGLYTHKYTIRTDDTQKDEEIVLH